MNVLTQFKAWFAEKKARFSELGSAATLIIGKDCPNPSVCLDVDTPESMARITLWQSGDCDLEVLELSSGNTIFHIQKTLSGVIDFDKEFKEFFSSCAIHL